MGVVCNAPLVWIERGISWHQRSDDRYGGKLGAVFAISPRDSRNPAADGHVG
jgi:hypothetical protein